MIELDSSREAALCKEAKLRDDKLVELRHEPVSQKSMRASRNAKDPPLWGTTAS